MPSGAIATPSVNTIPSNSFSSFAPAGNDLAGGQIVAVGAGIRPHRVAHDENVGGRMVGQRSRRPPLFGAIARREGDQVLSVGTQHELILQHQRGRRSTGMQVCPWLHLNGDGFLPDDAPVLPIRVDQIRFRLVGQPIAANGQRRGLIASRLLARLLPQELTGSDVHSRDGTQGTFFGRS